ncbi:TonB-dependent receptor [Echinicola marina]|uniref:SusC/RagA family TonB-linked outer membrane protein n=1 Tax=Echinicola marina TaxID=2859768 RepID=UPI001CF6435C|nr:TonB-dependent receptor [Echinicola marina]UCS94040.1 TonB-dependent receptor [Echinicola marina]
MKLKLQKTIYMLSKYFLYGFVVQMLVFNFVLATNVNGQYKSIDEVQVRINKKSSSLIDFFRQIEAQTSFNFLYDHDELDELAQIQFSERVGSVESFLRDVSLQTDLSFRQVNNGIDVKKREIVKLTNTIIQDRNISGLVVDKSGESLPGVNIIIKGSTKGTITDLDGKFSIEASNDDILVFSFLGFTSKEVSVGNQDFLNVTLEEDLSDLDEVVVVGYGTVKKSDLTGAVASVKPEELNLGSLQNIDQMLTGRMPGVQINQNSAEPGGSVNVRIRGVGSINAGNEPLYVIDGMPIDNSPSISGSGSGISDNRNPKNPLNLINPNDIASIEVLKDASATAIYGSRGANGVIMITTKRGSNKGTQVTYDFSGSLQQMANKVDLLSSTEFAQVVNDIQEDSGLDPLYDMSQVTEQSDWLDEITRTGYIQNHNLAVSGGNDKSSFYSSVSYYDQEGIVISSGMERISARLNAEFKASDKFRYGVNLTNSYVKNDNVPFGTGFNASAGVVNSAMEIDPTIDKFNPDGTPYQDFSIDMDNPLIIADVFTEEENTRLLGNVFGEYTIIPDLNAKLTLGFDRLNARKDTYVQSTTKTGIANGSGIGTIITGDKSNKMLEATVNYKKSWSTHNFNFLAGYTYQDFINKGFSGTIDGFPSDALLTNNFGLGNTERDEVNSYKNSNKLISYLSRVNYDYKSKYYVTFSMRADGSSKFGENNKFGYFPSMALSWRVSQESFLSNSEVVTNLKLRTSWGKTGNQSIGNFMSLSTLGAGGLALINGLQQQGITATRIPNPNLKWETTTQFDIGVDLELWAGRLNFVADYFIRNTDDLLLNLPLPKSSGFNSILDNVGSVENKGFELAIESYNIDRQKFAWTTSFNLTKVKNTVTDLAGSDQILQGGLPFTSDITIVTEGQPLNSYYGHIVDGIWQEGEDIANSAQPNAQPGYPKFRDISGPEGVPDGAISDADKTVIGSPFPDFSLGLRNNFQYGRLNLDVFFAGDFGQSLLNQNLLNSLYPIDPGRNRMAEPLLNRWTPQNPSNKWPSGVNPTSYGGSTVNSLSVEDATFIRLRNLRLSYDFNVANHKFLRGVNFYLQGSNLLLITDYMGFDPEVNSLNNGANSARADYNAYPNARTYSVGCRLSF